MKRYAVVRHPSFTKDAQKEVRWWLERNPERAAALVDAIEGACNRLQRVPESGASVAVRRHPGANARRLILGETDYLLFYEVEHDRRRVILIRLRHEKQRPLRSERRRPPR